MMNEFDGRTGKKPEFDPANEWDPITMTGDGGLIWHNYGVGAARRIVITRKGESPREVAAREDAAKERDKGRA
jgi:hypothetical protein